MKKTAVLALASLGLVTACATTVADPPADAVTTFVPAAACADTFSFAGALSLLPESATASTRADSAVTAETACYRSADCLSVPYVAFRLPQGPHVASMMFGSVAEPNRIFAARVNLYTATGILTRSLDVSDFRLRGMGHTVLVRPHTGEAYAVVEADPSLGGEVLAYHALDPSLPALDGGDAPVLDRAYSMEGRIFGQAYFSGPPPEDAAGAE